MKPLDIAIVGGGLGGPLLARILQLHGLSATVYERDAALDARTQGGMLDMHEESGQRALREAGLHAEFLKRVLPQGEAMRVLDKSGHVFIDEAGEGEWKRPEIDRKALRRLLVESLAPGTVVWNHKVAGVRALGGGRHEVAFTNGRTIQSDLLVGADGAWSKVRALLSDAKPAYCGLSFLELHLPEVERLHPASAALGGTGMLFALSHNRGILSHRHGDGSMGVHAALRVPEEWITSGGIDWTNAPAARAALIDLFPDWSPALLDLIRNSDDTIVPRRIHALPAGHSWERKAGVTLIGDAAHLMSPFGGEGANLALLDGLELGLALAEHPSDIDAALRQYEAALFPRSEAAAHETAMSLDTCFAEDAPHGLVAFFRQHGPPDE